MNKTQKLSGALLLAFAASLLTISTGCSGDDDPTDPCAGIECKNGGACVNGICECPEGYDGADCGNEMVPDNIRITKITYTKIPAKHDDGTNWDAGPLPDAYPGLNVIVYRDVDPNPNVEDWTPTWVSKTDIGTINNADPTQQHVFVPSSPILLSYPEQRYRISLYDEDGINDGDDELMGGITFIPYTPGQGHTVQIVQENSKVRFILDVTYDF